MRNGKDKNSCLFGEELVSYIYDELLAGGRASLEEHLLDCSGCTAELAEISMSRLGVYEWHRDEFVPLATPNFAIPYEAPQPNASWLEALRGLFASPMRLGFAGASLAAIVSAFVIFSNSGTEEDTVATAAGNKPTPAVTIQAPASEFEASTVPSPVSEETGSKQVQESRNVHPARQARVVQVKATIPKKRATTDTVNTAVSAPRLGSFAETEDKSLRLADLVADIDTRD